MNTSVEFINKNALYTKKVRRFGRISTLVFLNIKIGIIWLAMRNRPTGFIQQYWVTEKNTAAMRLTMADERGEKGRRPPSQIMTSANTQ